MNLPQAFVVHLSTERVRVRIPGCRGDLRFFAKVRKAAVKTPGRVLRVNALTASVLFQGRQATADAVAEFGNANRLFAIAPAKPSPTMAKRIAAPLTACDRSLKSVSAGQVDLPGAVFILLLFTALYEIARGRLRTPPWYTAFWYAFGLFTKALIDRDSDS